MLGGRTCLRPAGFSRGHFVLIFPVHNIKEVGNENASHRRRRRRVLGGCYRRECTAELPHGQGAIGYSGSVEPDIGHSGSVEPDIGYSGSLEPDIGHSGSLERDGDHG